MSASLRSCAVSALVMAAVGCSGRSGGSPVEHPRPATGDIEAAALPYQIVDARTGKSIDEPAFWDRLARAPAVCVGEEHRNPHDHWMQLHIVRELIRRLPRPTKLALAMEMFQRPFQGVLEDYAAKRIDDATLRSRSGYEERWRYDYAFYGPTIDAAVAAGAQLLAANAPKELTKKVVRHGLGSLTHDEKAQLPELELDDPAHRSWFDSLMEEMGGTSAHAKKPPAPTEHHKPARPAKSPRHADDNAPEMPSAERIYTVQVIWDETMADTSAKWLAANPGGHLILLAGNGHCHDSAIIDRMKRRGVADAVSVRGVIDDRDGSVGAVLARPINDYVLVLQMPAGATRGPKPDPRPDHES
jgi:uncharacterized iron-regulated protein